METIKFTFLILMSLSIFCGCKTESGKEPSNSPPQTKTTETPKKQGQAFILDDEAIPNVLNIALQSKDHTTLVTAVQAAGLENALVNAGPLMVFAPTDEAFNALPKGTVEDLIKPENKDALANILKYHVTPGNYSKDFLKKFKKLGQSNGVDIKVTVKDEDVYIGEAKIIASVPAGNGIVHVIDKVLLPPSN